MKIIYNDCLDPAFNLALEEHLLCETDEEYFVLWRNSSAVIVGRNQNTYAEIDFDYVHENSIPVIRRLTGGGAVFHDPGNVNYTFIVNGTGNFNDYACFCTPVIEALRTLGVTATLSGRNDLLIDGRKFSGNAQCSKNGRVMHHGTLMLSADIGKMSACLRVNPLKIQSKGIKSVQSRVTNISEHLEKPVSPVEFIGILLDSMEKTTGGERSALSQEDIAATEKLRAEKYSLNSWNYGTNKQFSFRKETKNAAGYFDIRLDIAENRIADVRIYGDYFINGETAVLENTLRGVVYDVNAVTSAVSEAEVFPAGVTPEEFALMCF